MSNENYSARDVQLLDIFNANYPYRIPKYQRPYDWSVDNAQEFMEDLLSEDSEIFLGSLVFDTSKEAEERVIEVIDGQQRLTTIIIFLSAFWRICNDNQFLDVAGTCVGKLFFVDQLTGKGGAPRLLATDKIQKFLSKTILDPNWNGEFPKDKLNESEKSVRDIYAYIKVQLEDFLQNKTKKEKEESIVRLNTKLFQSKVVRINVKGDDVAYMLFEVLNARGEPLNVSDLLKNYLLSQINSQEGLEAVEDAEQIWKEIEKTVSGVKKINMQKFIRYYWIGKNKFVTEKKLYKSIKRAKIDAQETLEELRTASIWLDLIANRSLEDWEKELEKSKLNHKEIYSALEGIRVFETTQCYVLFLRLLMMKDYLDYDYSKVFREIEKFHLHYSAINKLPGNAVEKLYQKYALQISTDVADGKKVPDFQRTLANLINELPKKMPFADFFEPNFLSLSYTSDKHLVRYLFDRIEEELTDYKYRAGFLDDIGRSPGSMKYTVDHIIPQDETVLSKLYPKFKDDVHLIGNLLIVERGLNGYMSNDLPKDKISKLAKSKLDIAKTFAEKYEKDFTEKNSYERAIELAKIVYEKIC